ncbi:MAG: OB-fold nucleic acid binding domain-containing protein, partial [Patescibacteria group bacterium]
MKDVWIKDIKDKVGETVELFGWVNVRRDHGKIIFIDLRDRSGIAQLVFTPQNEELYKIAETLRPEWVISVKGEVAKRPKG